MPHRFQCQTHVTVLDIGFDVVSEGWPVVFPSQQLAGLFNAKMAGQRVVVMPADELYPNGLGYKR